MNARPHCSECGSPLPAGGLDARCPSCLLRLALGDEAQPPPARAGSTSGGKHIGWAASSTPVHRIGSYDIIEEIARGGMGVVYKARQCGPNRIVALKRIASQKLATPEMVLRFQMETEAIAKLDHPNIVPLYETGDHDGVPFFTMKLIDGGNLGDRIARMSINGQTSLSANRNGSHSRAVRKLIPILIKVCRSVHHAHQRGILHRDLKPGNVLIDQTGEPHVSDFGLAKILESDSSITRTESILGSPNYMAPEQASGKREPVTTAADVYSLGAILYEILTGDPPFKAGTPLETLRQVIEDEPRRPRTLLPGIDRDLETISLRCLEKVPARRYASANDLADDLERWLHGEPVRARPTTVLKQAGRWARRNPALAFACVVAVASLVVLAIGSTLAAARIAAAQAETESLLTRSQAEEAERLLAADRSAEGLALLAHALRKRPNDLELAQRLASALSHRRFAAPVGQPLVHDAPILDAVTLAGEGLVQTVTRSGIIRRWQLAKGELLPSRIEIGKDLLDARFTRNGREVAVVTRDHQIEVWSLDDAGRRLTAIEHPHLSEAAQIAVSPAGELVAACARYSSTMFLFNLEDGTLIRSLRPTANIVGRFGFSSDGRYLAHGLAGGRVMVWDVSDSQSSPREFRHEGDVLTTAFSPDSRFLASGANDQTARVWDLREENSLPWVARHRMEINTLSFSSDSERLITGSWAKAAYIWDVNSGLLVCDPLQHTLGVSGIATSATSNYICTVAKNELWTWRVGQEHLSPSVTELSEGYVSLAYSPSGDRFVTGESDGTLRIWDSASGEALSAAVRHPGLIPCVTFHPDGQSIAAAVYDTAAWIRRLDTDQGIRLPHGDGVRTTRFDPSGARLVTASHDGTAKIWEGETGQPIGPALRHDDQVWYAEFSPDGRHVVTASRDATARIWDAASGRQLVKLNHSSIVATAQFSPDGRCLATASYDLRARLWPLAGDGSPVAATRPVELAHRAKVAWLSFSPDGRWLATASFDHTARIWNVQTGALKPFSLQHAEAVVWVAFSPDGTSVVTASLDHTARVWSAATGQPLTEPLRHSKSLCKAIFTPSGCSVATASWDGTVKVWPLPRIVHGDSVWLSDLAEIVSRRTAEANGFSVALDDDSLAIRQARLEPRLKEVSLVKWHLEPKPAVDGN